MGSITGVGSHLIIGEVDAHSPIKVVLDRSIRTDRSRQSRCGGGQITDVEADIDALLKS